MVYSSTFSTSTREHFLKIIRMRTNKEVEDYLRTEVPAIMRTRLIYNLMLYRQVSQFKQTIKGRKHGK